MMLLQIRRLFWHHRGLGPRFAAPSFEGLVSAGIQIFPWGAWACSNLFGALVSSSENLNSWWQLP